MRKGILTAVFFLLTSALAFGQATDANLVGAIMDPTGAALQNAAVDLENLATGFKATAHTNANGEYRFNNIPVGRYKVTASSAGFNPASLTNLVVDRNKTSTPNLTLQLG